MSNCQSKSSISIYQTRFLNLNFMFIGFVNLISFFMLFNFASCKESNHIKANEVKPIVDLNLLHNKAKEAFKFCDANKMNLNICILIDMGIHSGMNRFFVWDFKSDSVLYRFPVGHGCGINEWGKDESKDDPVFSNVENSHCSSLGKYKIGERAYSDWGVKIKYFMHGLESTNSNALKRFIVFHSWDAVSSSEIYPQGIPEGWGCPTISYENFNLIDPLIKKADKPILMWIYNGKE